MIRQRQSARPVLTDGPVGRHLIRLALPMVAGVLAMMGFNMVDTYFVGQLGTVPLAAMAMTFPMVMVVMSLSLGLSISTSIAVSQALGAKDTPLVRRLTTDALSLGVVLVVVFTGLGFVTLDSCLDLLGGALPTHDHAATYMRIWLVGLIFVIVPMVANMAVRATGDTVTPSLMIILGVVINCVLDPLLIFGWGPFPRLEIEGAAWATVISRAVTFVVALWIVGVRERMLVSPFVRLGLVLASWRRLLSNGIPIAMNNLVMPFMTGAVTRLTASLGTAAVAAFGVAMRVEGFALTPIFALQAVIGIFVGQNSGAGRWDRVREGAVKSEVFGFAWGTLLFLVLLVFGRPIAALFNPEPGVVSAAYCYFVFAGLSLGFRGLYLVTSAGLNSLNHAVAATILTVVQGAVIAVPVAWLGGRLWGLPGIFGAISLAVIITGLVGAVWLHRVIRRKAAD